MVEIVAVVVEVKSERLTDYSTNETRVRDTVELQWQDDANEWSKPKIRILNADKLKLGDAVRLVALPITKLEYDQAMDAVVKAREEAKNVVKR